MIAIYHRLLEEIPACGSQPTVVEEVEEQSSELESGRTNCEGGPVSHCS